jgi:hypothetical protein
MLRTKPWKATPPSPTRALRCKEFFPMEHFPVVLRALRFTANSA